MEGVLKLKKEIKELLVKEEKMWKQRFRALWLQEGDKNTWYFHSQATQRYKRNMICELMDSKGLLCMNEKDIAQILIGFYQGLFESANPCSIDQAMADIPPLFTLKMNDMLQEEYIRAEMDTTLHQMEALKAPGPDGMPPMFFQHYWQTIRDDVLAAVLSCLNTGSIPPSINKTFITLIPKVKSPTLVSEYRPISLCNILYKLVSKVIANRLKRTLPNLISDSQSAFQSDKAISNNILVAFETLHHMKIQKAKSSRFMALKLDMSKVYDRVEWSFLKKIMEKMGFGASWVQLVMECISMVSYSILVNGGTKGRDKTN